MTHKSQITFNSKAAPNNYADVNHSKVQLQPGNRQDWGHMEFTWTWKRESRSCTIHQLTSKDLHWKCWLPDIQVTFSDVH